MLESAKRIVDAEAGLEVVSQLIDHVQRLGTIAPRLEGRIIEAR